MKKCRIQKLPVFIGATVVLVSLTGFSVATAGLIEISPEVGVLRWVREAVYYALMNKFAQKLAASLVLGLIAFGISKVVAGAQAQKQSRRREPKNVCRFPAGSQIGRTA